MSEQELINNEDKAKKLQIQKNIESRVRKLEKYNHIDKKFSSDDMVKKIRKIVEEEVK